MKLYGRHYRLEEPVCLTVEDGRIATVEILDDDATDWPWVAPGLFDLQVNGYGGAWFSDESLRPEVVRAILEKYLAHGVTRLCPTLITNSFEAIRDGLAAIREACERDEWVEQMVAGCHVEGPYISPEDGPRGAHPRGHVRACDVDEFDKWQEASGERIRLMTLAPETEGAEAFIRHVTGRGVTVAIGHTAANSEQIAAAVEAGATLSTHLGNGTSAVLPRHPNHLWDQLAEPKLAASLITDGHHIPANFLRSVLLAKGLPGCVITCDASGLAGSPPGEYSYNGGRFEVLADGPIVIAGQRKLLAGSGQLTDECVATAMEMAGLSLADACDLAGRNPSLLLGCEEVTLNPGSRADLIVFEHRPGRIEVQATVLCGRVRYGALPA
jgi:N-acetylglucosamine-6-phosphate deacetylase